MLMWMRVGVVDAIVYVSYNAMVLRVHMRVWFVSSATCFCFRIGFAAPCR